MVVPFRREQMLSPPSASPIAFLLFIVHTHANHCALLFCCREVMEYDVAMVGAGPAGLAAAIRLKQLSKERGADLSVCVLEKGAEVGSHILSGRAGGRHAVVMGS